MKLLKAQRIDLIDRTNLIQMEFHKENPSEMYIHKQMFKMLLQLNVIMDENQKGIIE